ncbi:MAG: OprO/OprP family phosphate-selective porin [Planctomycetaceae bacterium]|jgi:phosphate-selective porin OprO/OprP|nr:OprO/OprP family phosphate-selective porin [Planctomycetaceae bacterium]
MLFVGTSLAVGCGVAFSQSFAESPPANTTFAPYSAAQNLPVYANDASLESRISSLEAALKQKQDKPDPKKGFTRVIDGRVYFDSYNVSKQSGSSTGIDSLSGGNNSYNGLRDLRIGVKGEGYDIFDYKVDLCFIEQTGSASGVPLGTTIGFNNAAVNLKDVWFGVKNVPLLEYVRIGHYRLEDGVSVLTGGTNTTFFEFDGRDFATGRRIAISSRHLWAKDTIRFFAGFFYDRDIAARNRFDKNEDQGSITNFRLTFLPYASRDANGKIDGKKILFFGGNYSYYDLTKGTTASFNERFGGLQLNSLSNLTGIATNSYNKFGLEFVYQNKSFTLQSETYANVYNSVALNNSVKDRTIWGTYVTAKYFLTGDYRKFSADNAAWGNVDLKHNLDLRKINDLNRSEWIGGLELAAKWAYTDTSDLYDSNIATNTRFTGHVNDITVGLNWYWTPQARWLFDYIHVIPSQQRGTLGRDHSDTDIFAASFRYNF